MKNETDRKTGREKEQEVPRNKSKRTGQNGQIRE